MGGLCIRTDNVCTSWAGRPSSSLCDAEVSLATLYSTTQRAAGPASSMKGDLLLPVDTGSGGVLKAIVSNMARNDDLVLYP